MELSLGKRRLLVSLIRHEPPGPPPVTEPEPEGLEPADLLRLHSRKVALAFVILATGLLAWSLASGVHKGLPSVALDWLFGLQLVRAALAFAIIAALTSLLIRGFGGLWPDSFLTTGFAYSSAEKALESGLTALKAMTAALREELEIVRAMKSEE